MHSIAFHCQIYNNNTDVAHSSHSDFRFLFENSPWSVSRFEILLSLSFSFSPILLSGLNRFFFNFSLDRFQLDVKELFWEVKLSVESACFGKYIDKYGECVISGVYTSIRRHEYNPFNMIFFSELTYIHSISEHLMGYSKAIFQIFCDAVDSVLSSGLQ